MTKSTGKCKVCGAACSQDAGIKVPVGWFCGYAHLFEYQREKTAKARERQAAKAMRKRKEDVKPIGYWRDKAQHAFNAFIRERDRDLGCVSCDKPADWNGQWHASHWKSVGARPDLRFNPDNCQKACSQCNLWLSGNPIPFKDELVRRIGVERVEWLECLHEPKRYRREDYQAIEAEYKAKLKELKQQVEG
jgi:hypothetical protein